MSPDGHALPANAALQEVQTCFTAAGSTLPPVFTSSFLLFHLLCIICPRTGID